MQPARAARKSHPQYLLVDKCDLPWVFARYQVSLLLKKSIAYGYPNGSRARLQDLVKAVRKNAKYFSNIDPHRIAITDPDHDRQIWYRWSETPCAILTVDMKGLHHPKGTRGMLCDIATDCILSGYSLRLPKAKGAKRTSSSLLLYTGVECFHDDPCLYRGPWIPNKPSPETQPNFGAPEDLFPTAKASNTMKYPRCGHSNPPQSLPPMSPERARILLDVLSPMIKSAECNCYNEVVLCLWQLTSEAISALEELSILRIDGRLLIQSYSVDSSTAVAALHLATARSVVQSWPTTKNALTKALR